MAHRTAHQAALLLLGPRARGGSGDVGGKSLGYEAAEGGLPGALGLRRPTPQGGQGAAHFEVPPLPLVLDPGIEGGWVDAELLDLPFGIAKPPPGCKLHADEGVGVASIVHRPYAHGALKGLLHHCRRKVVLQQALAQVGRGALANRGPSEDLLVRVSGRLPLLAAQSALPLLSTRGAGRDPARKTPLYPCRRRRRPRQGTAKRRLARTVPLREGRLPGRRYPP